MFANISSSHRIDAEKPLENIFNRNRLVHFRLERRQHIVQRSDGTYKHKLLHAK